MRSALRAYSLVIVVTVWMATIASGVAAVPATAVLTPFALVALRLYIAELVDRIKRTPHG